MRRMWKNLVTLGLAMMLAILSVGCVDFAEPEYITVTEDAATFENRYFYSQLPETEQILYRELYQGLSEQLDEFTVHCADGEDSNRIFYMVLMDFP